ncbi:unnamed protein product [Closterium sp. NIES-54]
MAKSARSAAAPSPSSPSSMPSSFRTLSTRFPIPSRTAAHATGGRFHYGQSVRVAAVLHLHGRIRGGGTAGAGGKMRHGANVGEEAVFCAMFPCHPTPITAILCRNTIAPRFSHPSSSPCPRAPFLFTAFPDHSLFPFFPPDPSALPRNPSDPQRGHKPLNSVKAIFFPTFNFSVAYFFSPYLMDAFQQQTNGAKRGGAHGYVVNVTSVHPTVVRLLPMYDVAVFSSGTWWLQNVPGRKQPNTFMVNGVVQQNITNIEAFRTGLKTLANHVKQSNFSGIPFFLTFNPKHGPVMRTARGDGACGAVQPIGPKGAFKWYESIRTAEEYFKMQRRVLTSSSNMRVVKVTRMSEMRPEGHLGMWWQKRDNVTEAFATPDLGDCTHWCLPGVPDAWLDVMYAYMRLEPALNPGS